MGELKAHASAGVAKNAAVIVSVRPEDVELSEAAPTAAEGDNVCKGTVNAKDFLGDYLDFHVKVGDVLLQAKAHPSLRTPTGDADLSAYEGGQMRRDRVRYDGAGT